MKCRWCNGTEGECGCGFGRCDHCNNGEVTDPPFGGDLRRVLPEEVVSEFARYWCDPYRDESLGEFIQRIAQYVIDHPENIKT